MTTNAARERRIDGTVDSVGGFQGQVKAFRKDRRIGR
jgi:hypothetical protein